MTNQTTDTSATTPHCKNRQSAAISADLIVSDSVSIDEPKLSEESIYYLERRPQEGGRCVIVKVTNNKTSDVLPSPYSARSRVHEYGGGSYCIAGQQVLFINDTDQDIYCINNDDITRITTEKNKRFADFCYDKHLHRLIAVCETHENNQVSNSIVSIDLDHGEITSIVQGNDFYASPRLNNAGNQLCWQTWNHPNMPWHGNQLWLASLNSTVHKVLRSKSKPKRLNSVVKIRLSKFAL